MEHDSQHDTDSEGDNLKGHATMSFYTDVICLDPRFESPLRITDLMLLEPGTREAVRKIIREALDDGTRLMVFETFRSDARQQQMFNSRAVTSNYPEMHHYGLACTLLREERGRPSWGGDFRFLGVLAKKHGLIWGGEWSDPTHVQRCSLTDHIEVRGGTWYPDDHYNPYE